MPCAELERPRRAVASWTDELDAALGPPGLAWEPLETPPYLLAPPPWPRGAFVIDPEAQPGPP